MLRLRDRDVHYGEIVAEILPGMIESHLGGSMHVQHNAAIVGPESLTEHENPDGIVVRAKSLRGSIGLYIDVGGSKVEASAASSTFIVQPGSLLAAVGSAS